MNMEILPIYSRFFGGNESNWKEFNGESEGIDFAVRDEGGWGRSAMRCALIGLKIVLFPWGIVELGGALVEKVVSLALLPAQFIGVAEVDRIRKEILGSCADGVVVRHVRLEKDGIQYSGMIVAREKDILNGKWALYATGNGMTIEGSLPMALPLIWSGHNVLMVNLPNVGRSGGSVNPESIGASQEVGIRFLESAIKAREIVLAGFSLGGAAIGRAVLQHAFREDVRYRVIRCMTFDSLQNMARKYAGWIGEVALDALGYELDNVAASRKLGELGIEEVVIQAEKDEVIGDFSLLKGLKDAGVVDNKRFYVVRGATHNDMPESLLMKLLEQVQPKWYECVPLVGRWLAG